MRLRARLERLEAKNAAETPTCIEVERAIYKPSNLGPQLIAASCVRIVPQKRQEADEQRTSSRTQS